MKIIKLTLKQKLNICFKILKTKGFSQDYTIKELLRDEF